MVQWRDKTDKGKDGMQMTHAQLQKPKPYQQTDFEVARKTLEAQFGEEISALPKRKYHLLIEDILKQGVPMTADRAEYWVSRIYLNKRTEGELDAEIRIITENIKDRKEKAKARLYLEKVCNRITNATIDIKEGVVQVDGEIKKVKERTNFEIQRVHEKMEEIRGKPETLTSFWKKIYEQAKKTVKFILKAGIPTIGATYLNSISETVKNAETWEKTSAVITVYALEEIVIKAYDEMKKKKEMSKLERQIKSMEINYDRDEQRLMQKAKTIRKQTIEYMKWDIETICKEMYGCGTSTESIAKEIATQSDEEVKERSLMKIDEAGKKDTDSTPGINRVDDHEM